MENKTEKVPLLHEMYNNWQDKLEKIEKNMVSLYEKLNKLHIIQEEEMDRKNNDIPVARGILEEIDNSMNSRLRSLLEISNTMCNHISDII